MEISLSRQFKIGPRILATRLLLASVLAVAAYTKISNPSEILATIDRSNLVAPGFVKVLAYGVIGAECVIVTLLVLGKTARIGLSAYAVFSSLLFGYSLWRWLQDIKVPCSCFGAFLKLAPWQSALYCGLSCGLALFCLKHLLKEFPERAGKP